MKHFMQPKNTTLREIHIPSSSDTSPNPSSTKLRYTPSRRQIFSKENTPPDSSSFIAGKHLMGGETGNLKSPLPPRPPNSRKRKLLDAVPENVVPGTDSGVQVIVRTRPPKVEEGEMIVKKISSDSLSINGQTLTFDYVADTDATQLDIFQLVGAPLVENCLAGFNSSVFAYGQTGSGKTYTMWGPANALLEENLLSDQQGLTPRVFNQLFSRINEEQIKHAANQIKYLCRCSFLEIYNEQITDLLDPSQKILQIREDVKSGVYVEYLTEECVYSMKDVTQLLIKGLSNRRTGATSINSSSSRSHSVFTCVVESRCKSTSDGISSLKTSKINLVDLAGSERQKLTGASGDRLKEAGNINRSLSQLGNLINILAEVSQTGKQRHIPYRDSRLTFLLQDSLGGNAKLAMLCAVSPSQSCKSETFSTLRFAHRAKAIKNKAVVNEVMQDDVNVLREVIRGLKDELVRIKANGNSTDSNGGYSTGWNARRSLNLLKFSINHHMTFPPVDDDGDTEMEIVEEVVKRECAQLESEIVASSEVIPEESRPNPIRSERLVEKVGENTEVIQKSLTKQIGKLENMILDREKYNTNHSDCSGVNTESCCDQIEGNHEEVQANLPVSILDGEQLTEETKLIIESDCKSNIDSHMKDDNDNDNNNLPLLEVSEISVDISEVHASNCSPPRPVNSSASLNLSIVPCNVSPIKSPIQSVSPKVNNSRKSLRTSTKMTASGKDHTDGGEFGSDVNTSFAECFKISASNALFNQTSNSFHAPTDHLAASLHRGLEVIDSHCQSSSLRRSSLRFSLKPADYKPLLAVEKVNVGVQTLPQYNEIMEGRSPVFLCSNCKSGTPQLELRRKANYNSDSQLVPVDGPESADKLKQVPKAVEKVLAGAIRREMAVEELCSKQMAEITQLNRLVHQYRHERECNAIIGQTREDKIVRLECLMDGVLPTDEFIEEEFMSLKNEHKLLKEKYENHPEVLTTKIELKRVQDELELYRNFHDLGEKDVLLEEIQDLRNQLQCYMDSSVMSARKQNPQSLFTHFSRIQESSKECSSEILEQERRRWTDSENKWIALTEELRTELQASRSLAVKHKRELDSEKKCAGELKEAMQMAMEGHARILEQYAELQEKHIALLARHRKIREGIDDVKKAAAKAGVRGSESKFINALAGEISALKVEREKERRYFRDENKGLQAQLRDTAEAVQAAGKLLVRLKEAEEAVDAAQNRATVAAQETEKAYKHIAKMKCKHEKEINILNKRLSEYGQPKEVTQSSNYEDSKQRTYNVCASQSMRLSEYGQPKEVSLSSNYDNSNQRTYNVCASQSTGDQQRKEEFATLYNGDVGELLTEPSWFSGYDRCNI